MEDDIRHWRDITYAMILCTHFVDEKTKAQKGDTVILDIHRTVYIRSLESMYSAVVCRERPYDAEYPGLLLQ